jgi:gluconate kinase
MVDWGYVGSHRFSDPFFIQTINQCLRHPANLLFRHRTPLESLGQIAASFRNVQPRGFIFHMSRCGSTLVSQMLAALPQNVVLSEAGPIDDVLRAHFRNPAITEPERIQWLQWLITALASQRNPEEKNLFIKFDSWHVMFRPLIQRAFPGVPWIFLYREPVEVMASAQKQLGGQMIPGVLPPELFGWDIATVQKMSLYEYTARVLARLCHAALVSARQGEGKLANYRQLPDALWPELSNYWNVHFSEAEMQRMLLAAQMDAKNPVLPFEPDSQTKRDSLSGELRELTHHWLGGVYESLEIHRRASGLRD